LLCVGALLIVCFFLPPKSPVTEIIEVTSQVVETPAPPAPASETIRIIPEVILPEVPVIEPEPEAVKLSEPVVPEPPSVVHYRLRWGDTLWDIAGTYYDNPWLYRSIAQYNGIQNPSHIISGTEILIPPR
jgi:nucleoid-associated protein YgaU